jgi:hypothetical protein
MNNLATTNKSDFTVLENGEAFISNRKLADTINVPESTLRDYFRAQQIVITQGVSYKNLPKAAHHFAAKGNAQALNFVMKLSEAGAKAFIYHEARYLMKDTPRTKTLMQLAREQVVLLEEIENMKLTHQSEVIDLKNKALDYRFELVDLKDRQLTEHIEHKLAGIYNLPRT